MMRLFSRYRQPRARRFGVGVGVLALCLQLAVTAWMPEPVAAAPSTADLVALFGEHALCIAAARGEAPADAPDHPGGEQKAPARDHGICCLFHANLGFAPPAAPPTPTRLAFHTLAAPIPDTASLTPRPPTGAARARAPPLNA
jgi:hypothetical protein